MKKELLVKDVIRITKGKLIMGNENEVCEKFCFDTRDIEKNDTFLGIKGERMDGSILWKEALDNGAKIVIVENINFT